MNDDYHIITGGAGFIGSHLAEFLVKKNAKVTVIDDLSHGSIENIKIIESCKNFKFINEDICSSNISEHLKGCTHLYHLAGLSSIVPSIDNPTKYYKVNVTGTLNILEASRNLSLKKFIYTASSSCYGIPEKYPTSENEKINVQYPYALTKYLGECLALHWCQIYKIPVISLRLFNVYGPRQKSLSAYGSVFGVFLSQIYNDLPLTVVGDGNQERDFTYVSDVIEAIYLASTSSFTNEIFNVGTGNPCKVNDIVNFLKPKKITYIPDRPGEPKMTWAENSKIKQYLNWENRTTLENGIQQLLEKIDEYADSQKWDEDSIKRATHNWFKYLSKNK